MTKIYENQIKNKTKTTTKLILHFLKRISYHSLVLPHSLTLIFQTCRTYFLLKTQNNICWTRSNKTVYMSSQIKDNYTSLVQTVSPNQIFVHILLESGLRFWLSTLCITYVQIWFVCLWRIFYGSWYAYAKSNNSNTVCKKDVVLHCDNMLLLW